MKLATLSPLVFATVFAFSLSADPVQAQASRTWVSGVGDDANPCSRTAPCKTFPGAISKTAVNGEINCLDPGGFGSVTITKSITIDCHGIFGSILHAGTNGINISFDSFTDARKTVNIRNLNLQGFDIGLIGIRILGAGAGSSVNIEDCLINGNFGGAASGILDQRGAGQLTVLNTTIKNMGGNGISIGASRATLSNVRVVNSNFGVLAGSGAAVMVSRAVVSNSATVGLFAAPGAQINVDSSAVSHNTLGVQASGGTIRLSNNDFSFNVTGVSGTVNSFSNNRFSNNGAGGTIAPIGATNTNPSGQQ